jgi:sarcosine oxidase, subunit beta
VSAGPRVAVVGAGAVGLSTAWQLATRGVADVTVLEAQHVASGSSSVSAGIFTRQYTDPFDIALRVESCLAFDRLERDHGLVLRRNGYLRLAHDDAALEDFHRGAELQRSLGVDDAVALDRAGLAALVPDLRTDDLTGGLFSPTDGHLDGQQLTMLYAELAEAAGVRIRVRSPVTGHDLGPGGEHVLHTPRGEVRADVVVNAAGAWAGKVGAILGHDVPVVPERHQACIMRLPGPLPYELTSIMDYVPGSGEDGLYLRPEGERQLLVGLHSNDLVDSAADPDDFYTGADASFVDDLIPMLVHRMPGLDDVGLEGGWSGLYPMGADEQFILGPVSGTDTVVAATGVGGVGVYTSPTVGRIVADWVVDGRPRDPEEARRFSPRRFSAADAPSA